MYSPPYSHSLKINLFPSPPSPRGDGGKHTDSMNESPSPWGEGFGERSENEKGEQYV